MKIQIICLFVSILSTAVLFSQNTYSHKDFEVYKEYSKNPSKFEGLDIYEVNEKDIDYLLTHSKKEFKMIYTFGYWCGPCVKHLPSLFEYINARDNIDLIILVSEKNDSKNLYYTKEYFKNKTDYSGPVFNVSDSYSQNKRRKYRIFTSLLVPDHSEYGYSLHILYNQKNDVIYASTYNENDEEIINKITQLTKK